MGIVITKGFSITNTQMVAGNIPPPPPTYTTSGLVLSLDAGLKTSYPGSGSLWKDTVGSRNFTLNGTSTPAYTSGNGGYLTFTGSQSQYATTTNYLPEMTSWSVEAWMLWTPQQGTTSAIVTDIINPNPMPGKPSDWYINYTLGGGGAWNSNYIASSFLVGNWYYTSAYTPTAGQWVHALGTYDGTNLKLYINGALNTSTSYSMATSTGKQGINLMKRWDGANFTNGGLSVVRIYNKALSLSEVQANYNTNRARL